MFSGAIRELVDAVISLRMLLEATLDFPEEEIEFLQQADARGQIARLLARLDAILDRSRQGALLREGLNVVTIVFANKIYQILRGEFDVVLDAIRAEMRGTFEGPDRAVFVMKVIGGATPSTG